MKRVSALLAWLCCCWWRSSAPALAQQTTGTIAGRLVDAQGAAVPGVTVTGRNTQTGFVRTGVTDGEGVYRLTALPVGTYDLVAELQGFTKIESKGIVLNVGQTLDVDMTLKLATVQESITVNAETPLIETSSSSVGGVVDISRIESLPLNGRQFANLAATIPGVGLGFHSDPTKSSQFSPQINGGNGRNVNYQIDGGDNNDDTVGGLLQLFPLEAIQEFNFVTQRFKAEYGRSNGGVMNIVTKSGTNNLPRQRLHALPRQVAQRADVQPGDRQHRQARLPALPVRRVVRRADRPEQGALLWRHRADAAGHEPGRQHAGTLSGIGRRLSDAVPREPGDAQGHDERQPVALPLGALRAQQQLAAVRRDAAQRALGVEHEREQVQLVQREPQLGDPRLEAQRGRLPVRGLQERHPAQQLRAVADLPERRALGRQPEHAAEHRADQVAVPR